MKISVFSRYVRSEVYKCFMEHVSNVNSRAAILTYTCDYSNGGRIMRCCSYVAVIRCYIFYEGYKSKILGNDK